MKKLFITLLLVVATTTIQAQEELTWHKDINKAIEISKQEQKPLFLFFTGSDWCGWCIRLQKEVFKTPEFISWAKEKVVLVDLDFPRKSTQSDAEKKQNAELQQTFQVRGFPTVWFVKPTTIDGKTNFEQLGTTGYVPGGPSKWLAVANPFVDKFVADAKPVVSKPTVVKKAKKVKKKKVKA